jgi:transcriptional regulator of acetoin/glycerol metabolism
VLGPAPLAAAPVAPAGRGPLDRARITDALAATAGNQKAAARALGVSRPTLVRHMDRLGIGRPRKRA